MRLLWILYVSCLKVLYSHVSSLQSYWRLLGKCLSLGSLVSCVFLNFLITFQYGDLSKVWYLNVFISDLCLPLYFNEIDQKLLIGDNLNMTRS